MLIYQPSPLNHLRLLNTGRVQTNVLQLRKTKKQTRAHPSLRDSTCPNPKSSNPSRSIPRLLLLCAALGVLATPHLLSQTQRGGWRTTPLEDGSCRLRWLSRGVQHLNAGSPRVLTSSPRALLQSSLQILSRV